jgi:hypothetical protein
MRPLVVAYTGNTLSSGTSSAERSPLWEMSINRPASEKRYRDFSIAPPQNYEIPIDYSRTPLISMSE